MNEFKAQIRKCNQIDWDRLREPDINVHISNRKAATRLSKGVKVGVLKEYRTTKTTERKLASKHGVSCSHIHTIINDVKIIKAYNESL